MYSPNPRLFIGLVLTLAAVPSLATDDEEDFSSDRYQETIEVFRGAGESAAFFDISHGYAVFPRIGRAGIGVGGSRGRGRVFVNGEHVGNTVATRLSVGLQLGAQTFSQIIFFEDERAFEEFTSGSFEFGADATAVAITAGARAGASTAGGTSAGASGGRHDATTVGGFHRGLAVFTVTRGGLMYEASIGGQRFSYSPR